jgi:Ca-activated chloride channel family protein
MIEIAAEDARSQLNVARRLVRPSPNRLLQDGEMPTLRVAGADGPMALDLGTLGRSLLSEPAQPTDPAGPARPPVEFAAAAAPVPPLPSVQISRAPAAQAAEELRKESAFTFLDDMLDLRLDVYTPDPAQPGYFRLRILPRADVQMTPLRKTVTFVIDASKSIPQHKLRAVCKGVTASLALLRPEDAFNVIIFRDNSQPLRPAPEPATDALKAEAATLLDDLEAKGETNVYQALEPLMQLAPQAGYPGQIILLTDGHPTAGIQDGRTLINGLTASNALRNTVFPYAGGNNVNRPLLDLLAYRNRGRSLISDDLDDIEKDLPAFVKSLNDPLLVNCEAGFVNLDAGAVYPDNLTDLYASQPIVLYGRYDPAKQDRFLMRLTGRAGDTPKEVVFETLFKDAQSADASVAQGWAFEKAYHLIGEISQQGETAELVAELRALSQQYGIKTSYD